MRTELGPHRSLVVWLLSTAHFQHTSKTFTSSALFIVLTPNIIASCWAFTYPSLYFAKHFMNIVKPSAGKVAHRIWWAAASILMKCSASRLFRTITPPPPLFETQHSLLLQQRHVWCVHISCGRRAACAVLPVYAFNLQCLLWFRELHLARSNPSQKQTGNYGWRWVLYLTLKLLFW